MRAVDIIRAKRDGNALTRDQITWMVRGASDGSVPPYQLSAWLMAVWLRGMSPEETAWLTDAMVRSGVRVDLSAVPGVKVDKHSTGGVGDKTSLVIAPVVAALGVPVPMMSGRGLGHTGGTLDKLESIRGFRTRLTLDEYRQQVAELGCALIGQTDEVAPADRTLYALRDVTATVESLPLICASILSKKIAEGIDALVLDVKTGSGAFMAREEDARALADALVGLAERSGLRVAALLTQMDVPLGRMIGNALEVRECVDVLRGGGPSDLVDLSVELAALMLWLGNGRPSVAEARAAVREALVDGRGLAMFRRIVERQGGDVGMIDDPDTLPKAPVQADVLATAAGFLARYDAGMIGRAAVALGAGRARAEDAVDPGVGFELLAMPGDRVEIGTPLIRIHANSAGDADTARAGIVPAITITDGPPAPRPLILDRLGLARERPDYHAP
ncbi:thymidine phosphorylase [Luteitalea sp. TBR-22]|uniref:thymidine phosphorylase n=1 Tax=Luteitalea sp. TBR-22 TaxID=2802971 RepID=UPI001AF05C35|nr:thymidine phosphorylase [Luteitalea sp. TBR-22]BCS34482.1 thymidine phosphorylase [Luteitalea sp. TBR-22]